MSDHIHPLLEELCAAGVKVRTSTAQVEGPGSSPRAALQLVSVKPISTAIARKLLIRYHYLHSLPAGTRLAFGTFVGHRLLGALTLGIGPFNAHSLVEGAVPDDCVTLTRLWLSDELPKNSESRVLGILLRSLRKFTNLKFVLSYADPSRGHLGGI